MASLITHYEVYSGGANNVTLTTPSFTPSNGEIIIVKLNTWDTANGMSAPTGGSQTYQAAPGAVAPGGFNGWVGIWVATISGSPGSMTVSSAPATAGNTEHAMVVERWSNAKLAASPVNTNGTGVNSLPQLALTTTATNSVISWVISDAQSIDPSTRAYLLSGVEDGLFDGHVGANGVFYFAYSGSGAVTSAGSYTYGLSAPGGEIWVMAGVEILDNSLPAGATANPWGQPGPGRLSPTGQWAQFPYPSDTAATVTATATLSGAGSITALATQAAPATLAGAGSASALATQGAVATLAGAGSSVAAVTQSALATLAGVGSDAATVVQGVVATTAGAGSVTGLVVEVVSSGLAGSGTISAPATQGGSGTLGGTGALAAPDAVEQVITTLGGLGSLSATAVIQPTAALVGAGTVNALVVEQAIVQVAGVGAVDALVTEIVIATAVGVGTLTAASGGVVLGTAALAATGSANATVVQLSAGAFLGIGTLSGFAVQQVAADALNGVGGIGTTVSQSVTTTLVGVGSLSATTAPSQILYPPFGAPVLKWAMAISTALARRFAPPSTKWVFGEVLVGTTNQQIPAVSTEYVRVEVAATANGAAVDPTADTVQFAFLSSYAEPASGDWKSGSWDSENGRYYAQCLVGPSGTVTLAKGPWFVWVKVTASPEAPVRQVGQLQIT